MRPSNQIWLLVCIMVAISCTTAIGQELVGYKLVDNNSVGLTVAPFEKWGMAIADIDNNGWPDIFTERWASTGYSRLYVNNEGVFQDITDQTPLESIEENETHTRTVALVDYDNDGDKDIFFGTDERLYFLQNDNNVFTEISESIGLVGHKSPGFVSRWDFNTGAWADYDLDGDLDVVICQTNNPDFYLFRNDNGTFTDVASEVGLVGVVPLGTWSDGGNITDRMRWVDFDLDGDPDLSAGQFLFRNDAGQFTEVSESLGFTPSLPIQNSDWFDYDNDGDLDFFKTVTYLNDEGENEFWENQDGNFVNVSDELLAVGMRERYRGLAIGDFDNDGDQDIFISININNTLDVLLLNEEVEPGVQEALKGQVDNLTELLPDYGWFGIGRVDGKEAGEYMAVFYRKDRFEVIEQSTFWLSETPENPTKGCDAMCYRIVTWEKMKDKK